MIKVNRKKIKEEGNIVVLKDLGLILDDPLEKQKSDQGLRGFLISKDYPAPKIRRKKTKA